MLHKFHRYSAIFLSVFIVFHLINHLFALAGVSQHQDVMNLFRRIYRLPLLEPLILLSAAFQLVSGLWFIKAGWGKRRGFFARAQAISGAYILFFLGIHISAVLVGRTVLDLNTNFYFAAAGMHVFPYMLFFIPYYFLAVLAFFTHVGCALNWGLRAHLSVSQRTQIGVGMIGLGATIGLLIVLAFSGAIYSLSIPEPYLATYQ